MVKRVNLLLIRMKNEGIECTHIALLKAKFFLFRNTLKYFVTLQILLMNLLSSSLCKNILCV